MYVCLCVFVYVCVSEFVCMSERVVCIRDRVRVRVTCCMAGSTEGRVTSGSKVAARVRVRVTV
jgi:hypothetical protein